jgi:hypothetical protein
MGSSRRHSVVTLLFVLSETSSQLLSRAYSGRHRGLHSQLNKRTCSRRCFVRVLSSALASGGPMYLMYLVPIGNSTATMFLTIGGKLSHTQCEEPATRAIKRVSPPTLPALRSFLVESQTNSSSHFQSLFFRLRTSVGTLILFQMRLITARNSALRYQPCTRKLALPKVVPLDKLIDEEQIPGY